MISRENIIDVFKSALHAVLPRNLIPSSVSLENGDLTVNGAVYPLRDYRGIHVFGSGKAAIESARAVEEILGDRITAGLVVSNYEAKAPERIEVVQSSHPLPTKKSVRAAELLMDRLSGLSEEDFFIYLLSGGASALVEKPAPPVTLDDLQETMKCMLRGALPIEEINAVRKHLSLVKGGKLGRLAKAKGIVLVISDVIGDRLDTIGSAPLYCDPSSYQEARDILDRRDLWRQLPPAVRELIAGGIAGKVEETPKEPNPKIDHFIIGSNIGLLRKGKEKAESLGIRTHIMSSRLRGEAREVSRAICSIGEEILATGHPFEPPVCLLFGGETTVTVKGTGKGGRNQEMSLAALREIGDKKGLIFLSAGTDGVDGDSDAAGAVADCGIYDRSVKLGLSINDHLNRNDSNEFFRRTGGVIVTGPTGTNVMDMTILFVGKETS